MVIALTNKQTHIHPQTYITEIIPPSLRCRCAAGKRFTSANSVLSSLCVYGVYRHTKQEAHLSQRDLAMLPVIEYVAKY